MMSTNPVSEFSLEIFRTGYYGGRFMKRFGSLQGKTQADPPSDENRLRECKWEPFGGRKDCHRPRATSCPHIEHRPSRKARTRACST
jgi:hypothetical protein